MSFEQRAMIAAQVGLCREIMSSIEQPRNDREALVIRERKQLAASCLLRWKNQVPDLIPESVEELQKKMNEA